MRILAVAPYYAPEGGGLERYADAILRRLAGRGHDVDVLTFTRRGLESETVGGVRIHRSRAQMHLGNAPVDLGFRRRVRDQIRRGSPDIIVAHTPVPFPAEMAFSAAQAEGIPFVTTYHAGRLQATAPYLRGLAALDRWTLERRMLQGSSRLITVGPFVRDHALGAHRGRVEIVPPGVDTKVFRPKGAGDGRTILFVGPLSRSYRWKGVDVLMRAFAALRSRHPEARLSLVGAGDRLEEFRKKAADGGSLNVLGRLSEKELAAAYQQAAVIVLPSTTDAESFGMVLAEANACGRPVVASDIGGIPDFVRHGENGLLAAPGDAADLAVKLLAVLEDPDAARRMGQRGLERVLREHDWDDLARRSEEIYASVVDRAPLETVPAHAV